MGSRHKDSEKVMCYQVSFLHHLPTNQISRYGGKATNLARLHQNGIPIPHGFVIPTHAFTEFISSYPELDSYSRMQVEPENMEELLQSATNLKNRASHFKISFEPAQEIINGFKRLTADQKEDGTSYAVRSSATFEDTEQFSFAGQADSFLCVHDQSRILEAVKQTWLSLYSPRAILYLLGKGIRMNQIQMAVIIQEMVLGDVSGVMFTANVVTNNPNQLIIDSTWGLGEIIMTGKAIPDSFILQKTPLKILKRRLGEKALYSAPQPAKQPENTVFLETPTNKREKFSITDEQLYELARIGLLIEQKMGFPQDIEWTYKDGKFVILQTRPITTL